MRPDEKVKININFGKKIMEDIIDKKRLDQITKAVFILKV